MLVRKAEVRYERDAAIRLQQMCSFKWVVKRSVLWYNLGVMNTTLSDSIKMAQVSEKSVFR